MSQKTQSITLAITGASGSLYALKLLSELLKHKIHIYLLVSDAAKEVFNLEAGIKIPHDETKIADFFINRVKNSIPAIAGELIYFTKKDWLSPVASGSNGADAMVICPTSMATLSAIAYGASNNLIERAADVMLKEKRPLLLVPREMPLSSIHLENMLKLSKMGVAILPASPGFYHQPETIDDIINFVVARILDNLQLKHQLIQPWAGD